MKTVRYNQGENRVTCVSLRLAGVLLLWSHLIDRYIDTDREEDRYIDRQTDRQIDRQTNKRSKSYLVFKLWKIS